MKLTLDGARSGRTLVLHKAASIGVEIILALVCLENGPGTVILQSRQTLHANKSEYFANLVQNHQSHHATHAEGSDH